MTNATLSVEAYLGTIRFAAGRNEGTNANSRQIRNTLFAEKTLLATGGDMRSPP
ncbi:hypothetical protein SDC9_71343 [bioreactor metagenome]|uniref:Uncharacterized protein n=1 Tax=bioreactor metagenome TaxID=1076179 RepID=A0A644Y8H0_9ZZZZ